MSTTRIEPPPAPPLYKGYPVAHEAANFGGLQKVLTSTAKALDDFHLECDPGGRCFVLIELADAGEQYTVNRDEDEEMESYTFVRHLSAVTVVQLDDDLAAPIAAKQRERVREAEALKKDGGQQSLLEQPEAAETSSSETTNAESPPAAGPCGSADHDEQVAKFGNCGVCESNATPSAKPERAKRATKKGTLTVVPDPEPETEDSVADPDDDDPFGDVSVESDPFG